MDVPNTNKKPSSLKHIKLVGCHQTDELPSKWQTSVSWKRLQNILENNTEQTAWREGGVLRRIDLAQKAHWRRVCVATSLNGVRVADARLSPCQSGEFKNDMDHVESFEFLTGSSSALHSHVSGWSAHFIQTFLKAAFWSAMSRETDVLERRDSRAGIIRGKNEVTDHAS